SSAGKRHYGHYTSATCGTFTVTATSHPGNVSTAASVTVTGCPLPVASVSVTPATATIGVGQTAQYAAITRDAFGNPLGGRTVTCVVAGAATITATSEAKTGTSAITVTAPPPGSSQFGHVFVVTEENTDYVDVTTSSMPYLMGLAAQYGLATQYYANTHPSIGN